MRRQLLLAEEPQEDAASLLARMRAVLKFGGLWHARAEGSKDYAQGATPEEAMRLALALLPGDDEEEPAAPPRRRGLIE